MSAQRQRWKTHKAHAVPRVSTRTQQGLRATIPCHHPTSWNHRVSWTVLLAYDYRVAANVASLTQHIQDFPHLTVSLG